VLKEKNPKAKIYSHKTHLNFSDYVSNGYLTRHLNEIGCDIPILPIFPDFVFCSLSFSGSTGDLDTNEEMCAVTLNKFNKVCEPKINNDILDTII
jgi:hypothetical protein